MYGLDHSLEYNNGLGYVSGYRLGLGTFRVRVIIRVWVRFRIPVSV